MRRFNPFHEGERLVQHRAGETNDAEANGQIIADTIVQGALPFLRQQPLIVVGTRDGSEQLWASVVFGEPGFVRSDDGRSVEIDLSTVHRSAGDPLWSNLAADRSIALIAIDLTSRRRLRVNGTVSDLTAEKISIAVVESFPNCPKYIQRRTFAPAAGTGKLPAGPTSGTEFTAAIRDVIAAADTFFVASAHPSRGLDVSHRGGNPGFVRILDDKTLLVPDYPGNSMFNTLGNFAVDAHAGLVFPDFDGKRSLQLTGTVEILWDEPDPRGETGGTERYWKFTVEKWIETDLPTHVDWRYIGASPYNPQCFA